MRKNLPSAHKVSHLLLTIVKYYKLFLPILPHLMLSNSLHHAASCRKRLTFCAGRLAVLLAGLLLSACSVVLDDEQADGNADQGASSPVYVSLTLAADGQTPATRAARSPQAGEDGDGREDGQDYENAISDLTIFFYTGQSSEGPAGNDVTLAASRYVSNVELKTLSVKGENIYQTEPFHVNNLNPNTPYYIIVVANMGDLTQSSLGFTTLDALRGYVWRAAPWHVETSGYNHFAMTSARGSETLSYNEGEATYENPAVPTQIVSLERLAARVDYRAESNSFTTSGRKYAGDVAIVGAALVNSPTASDLGTTSGGELLQGTYLLRRVTADTENFSSYTCLGLQTTADDKATNSVIDPLTPQKQGDSYDASAWAALYDNHSSEFFGTKGTWAGKLSKGDDVTADGKTWKRIGYTLENVPAPLGQDSRFATGAVFEAQFTPNAAENTFMADYSAGDTFIDYDGVLYRNFTQAMQARGGVSATWQAPAFSTESTWADVNAYISTLATDAPTPYHSYLEKASKGKNATANLSYAEAVALTWAYYLTNELGVSEDEDGKLSLISGASETEDRTNVANLRTLLHNCGTRFYQDGKCYYTYWIRHADDGDSSAKGLMENAIVRNNIYKLNITSVRDLGNDVPTDDSVNIIIEVAVKDWLMLPQETIEF